MNIETLRELAPELLDTFGRERLEETAFPVYTNSLPAARYLGWSRIAKVQRRLRTTTGEAALDFGSGLGVMLPFLSQRFTDVIACDSDPEITQFIVNRLNLSNVTVIASLTDAPATQYDVVTALDVLEHIEDLAPVYGNLLSLGSPTTTWYISGPTENRLYRLMRRFARTTGEGHVHTVHDVIRLVPSEMRQTWSCQLPFGFPLFVVSEHRR